MKYLLTGNEMAQADSLTSEVIGIPSIVLMERAALAVAGEIRSRTVQGAGVTILAGPGNNGADGLAVGRLLTDYGYDVQYLLLSMKEPPEGSSAMTQQRILRAYGAELHAWNPEALNAFKPDVIVDALFGTGLARPLSGTAAEIVKAVNEYRARTGCKVIGLDLPSGISSETGEVLGCAFECDLTVTFAYYKRGHFLYPGCTYCGETVLRQIGIHDRSFDCAGGIRPEMIMLEQQDAAGLLARRNAGGNKGTFGKILIIAGSYAMCGAALLSAEACMRSGAGMVKIFTREENRVIIQEKLPEAMLTVYSSLPGEAELVAAAEDRLRESLCKDLDWADAVVIGPAVGRGREAQILLDALLTYVSEGRKRAAAAAGTGYKPLRGIVIDADALRLIASSDAADALMQDRDPDTVCILTPHLAEFADLVHVTVPRAGRDRIPLLRELAGRYQCTVIGKDARTLIVSSGEREITMITNGNSGMATAGSGDVLTGIAAAMIMAVQGGEARGHRAAQAAAYIHAEAGDQCRRRMGERAMLAGDLIRAEESVFHQLENPLPLQASDPQ